MLRLAYMFALVAIAAAILAAASEQRARYALPAVQQNMTVPQPTLPAPAAASLAVTPAPAAEVVPLPLPRLKPIRRQARRLSLPTAPACRIPIVSRLGTCVFW